MTGGGTLCCGEMVVLQAALVMAAQEAILLPLCRREKARDETDLSFLQIMHRFCVLVTPLRLAVPASFCLGSCILLHQ